MVYQEVKGKKVRAFVGTDGSVVLKVLGWNNKWHVVKTTGLMTTTNEPVVTTARKDDLYTVSDILHTQQLADRTARRHTLALTSSKPLRTLK
jgi:hypothetical protein